MADLPDDGHRLVFVGGLHRSGTSLLARLIAAHPEATGLSHTGVPEDEGQHLQQVYRPDGTHGGAGRFARARGAHLTEASPLATAAHARRLLDSWQPHWDLTKPLLVEKSPPNLLMGRFLQALFPAAQFVFVVRHPVPVSLATQRWRWWMPLPRVMGHWFAAHDIARDDLAHLRAVHVVSYEHLIADPVATLAEVADFLGLMSPIEPVRVQTSRTDPYVTQWQQLLAERKLAARACMWRYGERAAQYGYDLTDLSTAPRVPLTATCR